MRRFPPLLPPLCRGPVTAALLAAAAALAAVATASCAGCSDACAGEKAGSAGCGCASDQDCTTRKGTVLLCLDGTCAEGNPEDVPGDPCGAEGDCGAGTACGLDQLCLAAPRCQRIDGALSFLTSDGAGGALTAARDDCTHTWSGGAVDVVATIDLTGAMTLTDNGDSGCTAGRWFAGDRLGALQCAGGVVVAVAPAGITACIGAAGCNACHGRVVDDDTGAGVCP